MNSHQDFINAQEKASQTLIMRSGRSTDLFKDGLNHIYKVLEQQLTTIEKIDYLRLELLNVIEYKLELRQKIDETYSIDEQIGSYYPYEETAKEMEALISNKLKEYEKINELEKKQNDEKLSLKQQMLLIECLGFHKHEEIGSLDNTKKAKLFSALLNRNEQNIRELLTYGGGEKKDLKPKHIIKTEANINEISELLDKLGLRNQLKKLS